jgi:hypothetical protein
MKTDDTAEPDGLIFVPLEAYNKLSNSTSTVTVFAGLW